MAQAQLIQGSATELMSYLQQHRDKQNLMLIVPEITASTPQMPDLALRNTADGLVMRNGVPLFPTHTAAQPVTMELVQCLLEEE